MNVKAMLWAAAGAAALGLGTPARASYCGGCSYTSYAAPVAAAAGCGQVAPAPAPCAAPAPAPTVSYVPQYQTVTSTVYENVSSTEAYTVNQSVSKWVCKPYQTTAKRVVCEPKQVDREVTTYQWQSKVEKVPYQYVTYVQKTRKQPQTYSYTEYAQQSVTDYVTQYVNVCKPVVTACQVLTYAPAAQAAPAPSAQSAAPAEQKEGEATPTAQAAPAPAAQAPAPCVPTYQTVYSTSYVNECVPQSVPVTRTVCVPVQKTKTVEVDVCYTEAQNNQGSYDVTKWECVPVKQTVKVTEYSTREVEEPVTAYKWEQVTEQVPVTCYRQVCRVVPRQVTTTQCTLVPVVTGGCDAAAPAAQAPAASYGAPAPACMSCN